MRPATTAFVVLTFPRTGSAWLIDTLASHPDIAAYGELFLAEDERKIYPDNLPDFATHLDGIPEPVRRLRVAHRIAYLRTLYRDRPGVQAAGFKLMYRQARENPGLLHYFALRRVRAIHLIRGNLLDAVVSYEVARKTGVFHPRRGEAVPSVSVRLDPEGTRERLGHMEWAVARGRMWLERFRLPRVEVAYEELVGRRDEAFGRLLSFLGVDPRIDALDSTLARVSGGSSLELVQNADEIRAALTGTRFEWMLGDPGPRR